MTKPHIRRIPLHESRPDLGYVWAVYSSSDICDRGGFPCMVCRETRKLAKAQVFKRWERQRVLAHVLTL